MYYLVRTKSYMTTSYYYDLIVKAVKKTGEEIAEIDKVFDSIRKSRNAIFISGSVIDAFLLFLIGKRNIIIWVQGVIPEESFMRNNSKLKQFVLEQIEKFVLKKSKYLIFVSDEMKRHYEKKYSINFSNRHFVMPCFNTEIHKNSFFADGKYQNNTFVYAGSLSVWQLFDKTLEIYKKIEAMENFSMRLLVLTPDIEKAKKLLEEKEISNYSVKYVQSENLPKELAEAKFGFVLREDNVVNRVATPTKFSTYISNGVIPIFTDCISDFSNATNNNKFIVRLNQDFDTEQILKKMTEKIEANDVYNEYLELFETYYNSSKYIKKLSESLLSIFSQY